MSSTSVEELFEENQKLVYFVVNKYYDWLAEDEDIIQEGFLGLYKASLTWNSSKSKFSTYATRCILNQIRHELRRRSRSHIYDEISLNTVVHKDESEITLKDILPDPKDHIGEVEFMVDLRDKFHKLTKKEKYVLFMLIDGYSQQDVATEMNCTRANVSRIKRTLLNKLSK